MVIIVLVRRGCHGVWLYRLSTTFVCGRPDVYLYDDDLDKQNIFNQR